MPDHSNAGLTVVVAAIAVWIAFAQWWTARNRFKLDLFEKRWAVYISARNVLGELVTYGSLPAQARVDFTTGIRGAKWLFNQDVDNYLWKELWKNATELHVSNQLSAETNPQDIRTQAAKKHSEIMLWLADQYQRIDDLFGPFLQLDQRFFDWVRGRIADIRQRTKHA